MRKERKKEWEEKYKGRMGKARKTKVKVNTLGKESREEKEERIKLVNTFESLYSKSFLSRRTRYLS